MKLLRFSGKPKKRSPGTPLSLGWLMLRRVSGDSMLPALKAGQLIIGVALFRQLQEGDVVILQHGGLEKIKRISQIKGSQLFVTGDNQAMSTDSRSFGWLPDSAVRAKVIWPVARVQSSSGRPKKRYF